MTTIFVLKSAYSDEEEEKVLRIFRSIDAAKALADLSGEAIPDDWCHHETKCLWTNVGTGDSTEILGVNLIGLVDHDVPEAVFVVRFNTGHERDIFLGAAATLEEAKYYAETVLNDFFKVDHSLPRAFDGLLDDVVWRTEEKSDGEVFICDEISGRDELPCRIELTKFMDGAGPLELKRYALELSDEELDALEVICDSADFWINELALDGAQPEADTPPEQKREYRYYYQAGKRLPDLWTKFRALMPDGGVGAEDRLAAIKDPDYDEHTL